MFSGVEGERDVPACPLPGKALPSTSPGRPGGPWTCWDSGGLRALCIRPVLQQPSGPTRAPSWGGGRPSAGEGPQEGYSQREARLGEEAGVLAGGSPFPGRGPPRQACEPVRSLAAPFSWIRIRGSAL